MVGGIKVFPNFSCGHIVIAAAVSIFLVACSGGDEAGTDEIATDRSAEPDPMPAVEAPERDVSGIDVCAELPADVLADAIGLPVAEPARRMDNDPSPNCTYRLTGPMGAERVDVFLKDLFDYDWARQTAENFNREVFDVEDLGMAAYRKKTIDGWWDVWAKRSDGLVVNSMAPEQEPAVTAARLAIGRIP